MKRKIIKIDEKKCNGCGLCVDACAEGALQLINGKAKLVSESYCDGLGACLPECPTDAISIEERESLPFDEKAVEEPLSKSKKGSSMDPPKFTCPGKKTAVLNKNQRPIVSNDDVPSALGQWPCQLKLVPTNAPYLKGAKLLIAADCTAFAYANIHKKFMQGKITLIGCPKLDQGTYAEKLCEIIKNNDIKSITVLRMEVPCCGGLSQAVKDAIIKSQKMLPWQIVTISIDGNIIDE